MIEILYSRMEFSKNCKYVFKKKSGMSGSLSAGSSNEKCSGLRQKDGWLSGPGRGTALGSGGTEVSLNHITLKNSYTSDGWILLKSIAIYALVKLLTLYFEFCLRGS